MTKGTVDWYLSPSHTSCHCQLTM